MIEILSIIFLTFAVYWRTFKFTIVNDDIRHYNEIKNGLFKRHTKIIPFIKTRLYGGGTFGLNTKIDHIFQTSLHALICVLMYVAFKPIAGEKVACLAALLYCVNPVNNQTSIWLNGRRYAINIILVLAMLCIGKAGLILYPLTALFQINALFAPLMFGWIGILVIPVCMAIGWKEMSRKYKERMIRITNDEHKTFRPRRLIVSVKTFGFYFWKMIFPGQTLVVYPDLYYWGISSEGNKKAYALDLSLFLGIIALSLALAGALFFKGQLFWLWTFMIVSTLQWCNFQMSTQIIADRYVSLPNVFMMFFVAYLSNQFIPQYSLVIFAALFAYYITNLKITMKMYPDVRHFWDYHNFFSPKNVLVREWQANWYLSTKDPMAAWPIVKRGLELNPNDFRMLLLASTISRIFGDDKMSLQYLARAEEHCYIGHEAVLKDYKNKTFGIDIDREVDLIKKGESKLSSKQRKIVMDLAGEGFENKVSEPKQ
jgi:hypothetical protein